VVERKPEGERHLAVHSQHCVGLNEADSAAWDARGNGTLRDVTLSGDRSQVRDKLERLVAAGITEIVYQPCGPEIDRELERFHDVASDLAGAGKGEA
jgi:5,10-methylenetetrahydromethanopterin reductase